MGKGFSGEKENFKHIFAEKYFDLVYRLALSRTGNIADAEDVTQEVFLRFLKNSSPFSGEEHIKAWLIKVTINCSKDVFLSSWHKKTVPLSEELSFEDEEAGDLYLTVARLPQKYRTVLHLFYYEDMSVKSISSVLKIPETTVKSQLSRGRKILKNMLEGKGYEEF